jgi:hypothetical protein
MLNRGGNYTGRDVVNAAKTLLEWDDPETGERLKSGNKPAGASGEAGAQLGDWLTGLREAAGRPADGDD